MSTVVGGDASAWVHVPRKLLEYQADRSTDKDGDVFAVTCVNPLPEYGLQPNDGPDEWTLFADCLYAIGYRPQHVLEIWSTWEEAATACRDMLLTPKLLHTSLMVVPHRVGSATAEGHGQEPTSLFAAADDQALHAVKYMYVGAPVD